MTHFGEFRRLVMPSFSNGSLMLSEVTWFLICKEFTQLFSPKLQLDKAHSKDASANSQPTIPDKRVGTRGKFSPPPNFNVDSQVLFPFLLGRNAILSNIDLGWGMYDTAQVSQLLLAGIVGR